MVPQRGSSSQDLKFTIMQQIAFYHLKLPPSKNFLFVILLPLHTIPKGGHYNLNINPMYINSISLIVCSICIHPVGKRDSGYIVIGQAMYDCMMNSIRTTVKCYGNNNNFVESSIFYTASKREQKHYLFSYKFHPYFFSNIHHL